MLASDVIAMIRSRLRDEAKEGWSDEELLSSLNLSLSAIAHRLMPWKARYSASTVIDQDTYMLPDDFMAPLALVYDGIIVEIKGIEWALSNYGSDVTTAFIDNNMMIISPTPRDVIGFDLNYHALIQVSALTDVLRIPTEMVDALLYYTLSLSLQKEPHEQSLAQSKYFLDLFEKRCEDTAKIAMKRHAGSHNKSNFQKV